MNMPKRFLRSLSPCLALLSMLSLPSQAGVTDIATAPLFTSATTVVKPNVLFTLDDSGSMAWDFMPDDADFSTSGFNSKYGRRASQCNGLAYNPNTSKQPYRLPVDATGATVANASTDFLSGTYTSSVNYLPSGDVSVTASQRSVSSPSSLAVVSSGSISVTTSTGTGTSFFVGMVVTVFGTTTSGGSTVYDNSRYMIGKVSGWNSTTRLLTVDVAMSVGSGTMSGLYVGNGSAIDNVYYTYSGSQKPLNYQYPGNALDTSSTFYAECNSSLTGSTGKAVFSAVIVTPSSAEAQRYANWYYYYSTRMRMMKTSLTLAFKDIDDRYRIGFATINENTGGILDVKDFDATQKTDFYSRVNGAVPKNSTPLRAALSKAGNYFAKKVSGQTYDPVQYSCQKNFTILSTDGYWNGSAGYNLDGAYVGQQDGGTTERPMYDGGVNITTTRETWTVTSSYDRTTTTPITTTSSTKKVDTTYTPYQGQSRKTYSLTTYAPIANSSLARCGGGGGACTITVTTSSAHGLSTGNTVTIAGASPTAYNGTFSITRINSTQYTYTLPSRPSSASSDGTTWSASYSPVGCGPNEGKQYEQLQTRDLRHVGTVTTTTTNTTPKTRTLIERITSVTPYTHTVVVSNGVTSSDTTTSGTPTTTTTTLSDTTSSGTTTTDTSTATAALADDSTAWVNSGSATLLGACISTASSTTATTVLGSVTTATATASATTTTGPADASGASASTNSATTSTTSAKTTTTTASTSGGSNDTLADVAMYYYQTDLRTSALSNCTGAIGKDVCENNVSALGADKADWQHMSTYTLSLGMSGTLTYDPNYPSQTSGDYYDIVTGNKNWPVPSSDGGAVNIDDLWHAAVNGRGRYFSASDPASLASSLSSALSSISAVLGTASAAATSSLEPVEGDNGIFVAQFKSAEWTGDLRAYKIDVVTGAVDTTRLDSSGALVDTADWSAAARLSPSTSRNIYYAKSGALRSFTYANLTADGLNGYFDGACSKSPALTQCSSLSSASLTTVNSGSEMVSFLRGQPQALYRTRSSILGDIVNSSPVYISKPRFRYTESAYAAFKAAQATRAPTIYVGANDGMLHAFDATTGDERWAYIPSMVMPNMYRLADSYYESKHVYFVDATPVVGDIQIGGVWKTILVGGLNAGGSGYYALDITDPLSPKMLWEFTHANLGLSFGNPVITKRKDGTWIVAVTSGYNNADGLGHLFILNANTGALLKTVDTTAGSGGSPSGLAKLNAWVIDEVDNTAERFYAADLLGNVWRIDIDDVLAPKSAAFKLAQVMKDGVPQPITTTPQLAEIESAGKTYVVVYVGTGRYLGKTDVSDTSVQSIYAIKDALGTTSLDDVRGGGTLVQQELTTSGSVRTVSKSTAVDWTTQNGWFIDLLSAGERINVNMQLAFNVLVAAGNIPGTTATDCSSAGAGTSWLYQLDIANGLPPTASTGSSKKAIGAKMPSMVAGMTPITLRSAGAGSGQIEVTLTSGGVKNVGVDMASASASKPRRSSWRELID